jgi:hypothetical protein
MNGTKVREADAIYTGRHIKSMFNLRTGRTIRLEPLDRVHIVVNEYGNAYIDDQFVGDESEFMELER